MLHKSSKVLLLSVCMAIALPVSGQVAGQVEQASDGVLSGRPLVTAVVSNDQIRLTALALTQRIRLEVLSQMGESLYDSDFQPGNRLEWGVKDQQGAGLRDGVYGCLVTVEDLNRQMSHRRGIFWVKDGAVSFNAVNKQAASATSDGQENLTILCAGEPSPFTLVSHDGKEGWIETASGGLNVYAGSLLRGRDSVPHLRLTPEGNLGIGVADPQAKLDVGGLIRSHGIIFPDGTIQRTAAAGGMIALGDGPKHDNTVSIFSSTGSSPLMADSSSGPAESGIRIQASFGSTGRVLSNEVGTNTWFGDASGASLTSGSSNSFFGSSAGNGTSTGDYNSLFGYSAGHTNTSGSGNSFFGTWAGQSNATGWNNSFFGSNAGSNNTATGNSFFGAEAGFKNTSGLDNAFFGYGAGYSGDTANYNSFFGQLAGYFNTGSKNSFFGRWAGHFNSTGENNSFFGFDAGIQNTTSSENSFFGSYAGSSNTTGYGGSFFGSAAGMSNTTGSSNSFFGGSAGIANTTGDSNSFFGNEAGWSNMTGGSNSFFGFTAGMNNITGQENSFIGTAAGHDNNYGNANSFLGYAAGRSNYSGNYNSFVGHNAGSFNTTGGNNTFLGYNAGASNSTGSNNTLVGAGSDGAAAITNATAIGNLAKVTQSNSLVLGSINGVNSATADTKVGIGTTAPVSHLNVTSSSTVSPRGVTNEQYNNGMDGVQFRGRKARGTPASPAALQSGDVLGNYVFDGHDGAAFGTGVQIRPVTEEAWSSTAHGAYLALWTTPPGTTTNTEKMRITGGGNVGIGTSNPTERLQVVGNLKISGAYLQGAPEEPIPDFVFEPDYKLMSVEKLQSFLEKEKHLPNIPSAAEIKEKGLNLGEFQMKLLEKIEELTLYTVQQAKMIREQQNTMESKNTEISSLKSQNAELDARLAALEQLTKRLAKAVGSDPK